MNDYIVRPGDTLGHIAQRKFGRASRWPEIAALNGLACRDSIYPGQRLKLPGTGPLASVPQSLRNEVGAPLPASVALARGYLFVVFEQLPEVGTGRIIRKVAAIPRDFSLIPANPLGRLSLADHVLNHNPFQSQFLSASNRPFGAPSINGQALLLDVAKIQRAGGRIYSVTEVVADLERFVAQNPMRRAQVDKLISTIRNIEGEVLVQGSVSRGAISTPSSAHSTYIQSAEDLWAGFRENRITRAQLQQELTNLERAYARARVMGRVGRVFMVVGVVMTAVDLGRATQQSVNQSSFRPLGAEVVRQAGGWGMGIAGAKVGFAAGALFGIETGPGAILTGAIGAIVFGAAGYFGADWVADHISPN
ncbi:MAG TPA: LysM peptidoglycan-binding domain-containing protein [Myxococcus sp.]|nr:LysM peptidoglycan-binding domain-containing protein [Myxococcus sp.]